MVAIRLSRVGAKKKPSYRVVVMDKRRARDSRNIEIVGFYNPRPTPIEIKLERERIDYWIGVGAQPSERVKRLIKYFDENGENMAQPKKAKMRADAEAKEAKPVERPVKEEAAPAPAEEAPAEEAKAEEAKADEAPAEEAKADEAPAAEAAAEDKPAEEAKADETPAAEETAEEKKEDAPASE